MALLFSRLPFHRYYSVIAVTNVIGRIASVINNRFITGAPVASVMILESAITFINAYRNVYVRRN